jgi:hypothetical protein
MFNAFFPENHAVYEYGTAGQATDENTAHALCELDNQGYRHTLSVYNIYCFFTGTVLTRTRLDITFIRTSPVLLNLSHTFVALSNQKNISCLQI